MSRTLSTDLEHSSEIPTWIVLVCSGLALVLFFGWIVKDLSALVSPDQGNSLLVQPLPETGSVSGIESDTLNNSALQRFARQKVAEPASYQQSTAELSATERNSQRGGAEEHDSPAYAGPHQSETTQAHANTSAEAPLDSGPTEASEMENDRTNKAEQATEGSVNTTLSQAQRPPADLEALRQLLAEAAAFNETEDEQVRAERERRKALESLGILSAAIQFAPGSKVASEAMTSTLNQIQRILADYPETMINVIVATNESGDEKQNMRLSQERGRTLIARLVNNGLAFSRFSLDALTDEQLPANTHRVEIQAHPKS